jgi:tetratricopeptide (TPR) repeat protein
MAIKFQPYVGPRPFELKDKDLFFGREREARELLSLVIAHNVVFVYAQSGAGKTSLLNARLIPMLKENAFEVFPMARVKGTPSEKIKNEDIPNIFVFNTLMSWAEGEKSIDIKNISQMALVNFLSERKHPIDETDQELPRAIIFDQFEEMFSVLERWKDREGFFAQISEALRVDLLLRVVFVMREDYIAQLDPYADLLPEKLRTRFRLERLNKEAALLAVKEPLKNTGRYFAEGVAEKLVDDMLKIRIETNPGETNEVAGEFIEAVQLQVICQNLWLGLPENVMEINMRHLETFGDVEKALSQFYDEALKEAATNFPIDEERLRQWCEEMLITSMGTRSTVYRAPESTGGVPNEIIDFLDGKHLIRAEIRAGARWYELTHDRFIEPILSSNKYYRSKDTDSRKNEDVSRRANQAIKKAEQAWGEKNYEEALKWFEEALANYEEISDSKRKVNTYLGIANIYYEMENYELTIEKCQTALEIDPKYVYAYSKWGSALSELKRYEEAFEKFQKTIEIDPNYASGWYNKACLLSLTNGDGKEISKSLAKAIELDPKFIQKAEKDLDFKSVKNRTWFKNILSNKVEG